MAGGYKGVLPTPDKSGASGRWGINEVWRLISDSSWPGLPREIGDTPPVEFINTSTGRSGTIQEWTVPMSGFYQIAAKGARGASTYLASSTTVNPGGNGAVMQGDFELEKGHVINIMVGQTGIDLTQSSRGAGGGGGTFVYNVTTGTLLLAAGGGGGAGQYANGTRKNAVTGSTGVYGSAGGSSTTQTAYGTPGTGPDGGTGSRYSGCGAGFSGDGADPTNYTYEGGGHSYTNGGLGGIEYDANDGGHGGYGGGGGTRLGGGGGGGYGGGLAGDWSYSGDGGGGGSFNAGTNQVNTVENTTHGSVIIT